MMFRFAFSNVFVSTLKSILAFSSKKETRRRLESYSLEERIEFEFFRKEKKKEKKDENEKREEKKRKKKKRKKKKKKKKNDARVEQIAASKQF